MNQVHLKPRPYRPIVRYDVFPISLQPRGARIIGGAPLIQLPLPEPKQTKIFREWTYAPYEESA